VHLSEVHRSVEFDYCGAVEFSEFGYNLTLFRNRLVHAAGRERLQRAIKIRPFSMPAYPNYKTAFAVSPRLVS
jgi:hypothetical protein